MDILLYTATDFFFFSIPANMGQSRQCAWGSSWELVELVELVELIELVELVEFMT